MSNIILHAMNLYLKDNIYYIIRLYDREILFIMKMEKINGDYIL